MKANESSFGSVRPSVTRRLVISAVILFVLGLGLLLLSPWPPSLFSTGDWPWRTAYWQGRGWSLIAQYNEAEERLWKSLELSQTFSVPDKRQSASVSALVNLSVVWMNIDQSSPNGIAHAEDLIDKLLILCKDQKWETSSGCIKAQKQKDLLSIIPW